MSNHVLEIFFLQGLRALSVTDDRYAFELGYSPSAGEDKAFISETLTLMATGKGFESDAEKQIKQMAIALNRMFLDARQRWGSRTDKPDNWSFEAVYLVVNGLKAEILDGRTLWDPISFLNWKNGKAILPIHITRKAFFEGNELRLIDSVTLKNDGVNSNCKFFAPNGDLPSIGKLILRNTTDSQNRSNVFWIGASRLPHCVRFNPVLVGDGARSWSGGNWARLYVWEISGVDLSIAKGTTHNVIVRFKQLPPYQPDFYSTKVRLRITIEQLTDLFVTDWIELTSSDYQMIGVIPLPPYYLPVDGGRLYLHLDAVRNQDATHTLDVDFVYLMPSDAGWIELYPHGYSLPHTYSLIIEGAASYVSSGHAYYTKTGKDLTFYPGQEHMLHVLHDTWSVGVTERDRTTDVSLAYKPRFNTFDDSVIVQSNSSQSSGNNGNTGIPSSSNDDDNLIWLEWEFTENVEYAEFRIAN